MSATPDAGQPGARSPGVALSRAYHDEVVAPLVAGRWPRLAWAAGRLGSGSDVLGLDDEVSRDHDWGLRLNLLLPADAGPQVVEDVDRWLEQTLPPTWCGHPTRFGVTWDRAVRHRVQVETAAQLAVSRLGVDPSRGLTVTDWLCLTGQAVLEVTAGEVFVDRVGELTGIRSALAWYPDDVWRHVVAVDWWRLSQELPVVGRTGERGDDLGSRLVAARLVGVAVHLALLLERRWAPYPKWRGTVLAGLPAAARYLEPLSATLSAEGWRAREAALVAGLRELSRRQSEVGLPAVPDPVEPFWDRRQRGVRESAVSVLREAVTDPDVRALPVDAGSAEQLSDDVGVLVDAACRGALVRAAARRP